MKRRTLIIGGTGTIGQSLIGLMQKGGEDFVVLARSESKAKPLRDAGLEVIIGELGNWPSIEKHLDGIDTIFLLTNPAPEQVALQNGLIDLAEVKSVRKIVKISALGAKVSSPIHLADWHGRIEEYLKASSLDYVILQPHSFMQNMLMSLPMIKQQSAFHQSLGDSKIPLVDTRDIAKASYQAIVTDDYNNSTYVITGGEPVSYDDMANALSKATGKNIKYIRIPVDAHRIGMKEAGVPSWLADDLANMNAALQKSAKHEASGDFELLTQARQVTIDDFAQDYADIFR